MFQGFGGSGPPAPLDPRSIVVPTLAQSEIQTKMELDQDMSYS